MFWKAHSRRDVELLEKQERMENALDDFRRTLTDVPEDLPWEMREILKTVGTRGGCLDACEDFCEETCHLVN